MLGWLHAVPEGEKQARMSVEVWPMPKVENLNYLIEWFFELGLSFGYQDIKAWSEVLGTEPNPIEVNLLTMMSNTYSNSLVKYRSKDHNLLPPYDGRTEQEINDMIAAKMQRAFERF